MNAKSVLTSWPLSLFAPPDIHIHLAAIQKLFDRRETLAENK